MEWKPIEIYDKLKKKPEQCVFYVEEFIEGRTYLPATYSFSRTMGQRKITKFFVFTPPSDKELL